MKKGEFYIRDTRNKSHYIVDDEYLNGYAKVCGIYATGVYNVLCRHADFHTQKSFPSAQLISEKLGISKRTVFNALEKLEAYNIIIRDKVRSPKTGRWRHNTYTLVDKSLWKPHVTRATGSHIADSDLDIHPSAPRAHGVQVHLTTSPSASDDVIQVHHVHTKDSHVKDTHIKDTHISESADSQEISLEESFNLFWDAYPKKELKKATRAIWASQRVFEHLHEILLFIEKAKKTDRWKNGYIKQPTTFLRGECWNDDLSSYGGTKKNDGVYQNKESSLDKIKNKVIRV